MSHEFPTLEEVIIIHQQLIRTFGGDPEIRDIGALEAALMRPQLGYYRDLIEEAAAFMESLANNHPFLDGNKRVAFFVTDTFLRMNGCYIECNDEETHLFFMELFDTETFQFKYLVKWLKLHVKRI